MCFAYDASPPDLPAGLALPRLAGGAAPEIVEVTSGDGTVFSAALALAGERRGRAVAIVPDVRGLYPFYIDLADRFAAAGHDAITIDPFGRTAGLGPRDEEFDFWPHVHATTPEGVRADLAAAVEVLRERSGERQTFAVLGFCFGGAQAFLAATDPALGASRVIGFYGALDGSRLQIPSPKDQAQESVVPVLGLFGGADEGIPAEHRETFEQGLARAGVAHEVVVYAGAPHSFFDRRHAEHAEACEDAWRRTLTFLQAA